MPAETRDELVNRLAQQTLAGLFSGTVRGNTRLLRVAKAAVAAALDAAEDERGGGTRVMAELTHACPPDGEILTSCCGRTMFELPRSDRSTLDPNLVTCPAGGSPELYPITWRDDDGMERNTWSRNRFTDEIERDLDGLPLYTTEAPDAG